MEYSLRNGKDGSPSSMKNSQLAGEPLRYQRSILVRRYAIAFSGAVLSTVPWAITYAVVARSLRTCIAFLHLPGWLRNFALVVYQVHD